MMKSTLLYLLAASLGLFVLASTASAHHSVGASFDTSKPIVLKGVMEQAVWANPHAHLLIGVKNSNGISETWAIELGPPNALIRGGFDGRRLKQGDEIAVTGFGQKQGVTFNEPQLSGREAPELAALLKVVADRAKANRLVHATVITLPDGRKLTSGELWR